MNSQGGLTDAAAMTQAVEQALASDKATARYPIQVAVQGTTVTLTGDVDSQADKDEAERVARGAPNVVDVINELVVRPNHGGLFGRSSNEGDDTEDTTADGPVVFPVAAGTGTLSGSGAGTGAGTGAPLGALGLGAGADEQDERDDR